MSLKFNKKKFLNWEKEYWWKPADDVIYEMFKKPDNKNMFRSKLSLFSLYYRTNIEKKADITDIADKLLHSSEYEYILQKLSSSPLKDAIFDENTEIYSVHYKILQAIKKITKSNEPVFASKFLHFLKPLLFPILDSIAEKNINNHAWVITNKKKLERRYENFFPNLLEGQYNERYCWHCFLLLNFSKYIQKNFAIKKEIITPKSLDIYF